MNQLSDEHKYGRKGLKELVEAKNRNETGDKKAKLDATNCMRALAEFYPRQIEKEDRHFFLPCMDYFSRKEKQEMLEESRDFDQGSIHKQYSEIAAQIERHKCMK